MVKAFHRAGIEVILDVVFNHTSEGNQDGPTINFKSLDNRIYYHLVPSDKQYYLLILIETLPRRLSADPCSNASD